MIPDLSDALVFFGATGDLAYKKIFPALYALVQRGSWHLPIIGVGRSYSHLDQFKARVTASLRAAGEVDAAVFARMEPLLRYVQGDDREAATYSALREVLGEAKRPLFFLAIPPSMFSVVVAHLADSGCARQARVMVEKPFGRDLVSAQALNQILLKHVPESAIFRIDHYLGKEPVQNLAYFRFANPLVEIGWDRESIECVQVTMAESQGLEGRGKFYEEAGAIRDVLQNHMLQVVTSLAMECPISDSNEAWRAERSALLRSMLALDAANVVRGQFRGYQREPGVAGDSRVETFAAARFQIENRRWSGVPFFVRVGKRLPTTATEVLVQFKRPYRAVLGDPLQATANHYRFRISPEFVIAIGARVKKPGEALVGDHLELRTGPCARDEMLPYARLIGDAVKGDPSLFSRQDTVEEAWRIVTPVLGEQTPLFHYDPGTWGPAQVNALTPLGGWRDPGVAAGSGCP